MFNCPYANESFPVYAEDIDGGNCPSVDALSEVRAQFYACVLLVHAINFFDSWLFPHHVPWS